LAAAVLDNMADRAIGAALDFFVDYVVGSRPGAVPGYSHRLRGFLFFWHIGFLIMN
jgi:hypothetical protein